MSGSGNIHTPAINRDLRSRLARYKNMDGIVYSLLLALVVGGVSRPAQADEAAPPILKRHVVAYEYQAVMGEAPIWHPLRSTLFWLDVAAENKR